MLNYFNYFIFIIAFFGVFSKFIVNNHYQKIIRQINKVQSVGSIQSGIIKKIKTKFEEIYKNRLKVNNVGLFVDKYLLQDKIFNIPVTIWENLNTKAILLCFILAIIGSFYGFKNNISNDDILNVFLFGMFVGVFLIWIELSFRTDLKKQVLEVHIEDYLENFLKSTLENKEIKNEIRNQLKQDFKEENKRTEEEIEHLRNCINEMATAKNSSNLGYIMTQEEKQILESFIKEFFLEV